MTIAVGVAVAVVVVVVVEQINLLSFAHEDLDPLARFQLYCEERNTIEKMRQIFLCIRKRKKSET